MIFALKRISVPEQSRGESALKIQIATERLGQESESIMAVNGNIDHLHLLEIGIFWNVKSSFCSSTGRRNKNAPWMTFAPGPGENAVIAVIQPGSKSASKVLQP